VDIDTVVLTRVAPGSRELEIIVWRCDGDIATICRS